MSKEKIEITVVTYKEERLNYFTALYEKAKNKFNRLFKKHKDAPYLSDEFQKLSDAGHEAEFLGDVVKMLKQSEGEWQIKSEIHQMLDDVDEELYVECPFCQRRFWVPYGFEDEEIFKYAREHYPYCNCGAKMKGGKSMNNIADDLQRAYWDGYDDGQKEANPKWISVDERLPKELTHVIVCDEDGTVGEAFCYKEGRFEWIDSEEIAFVTHWMPLPEPPKKGGAE